MHVRMVPMTMYEKFSGHIIQTCTDEIVEPGHQIILVGPADEEARAILYTLTGATPASQIEIVDADAGEGAIRAWVAAPHDERADERLVALVDLCAELRFTAPSLLQIPIRWTDGD